MPQAHAYFVFWLIQFCSWPLTTWEQIYLTKYVTYHLINHFLDHVAVKQIELLFFTKLI